MSLRLGTRVGASIAICVLTTLSSGGAQHADVHLVQLAVRGLDSTHGAVISDDGRYLAFVAFLDSAVPGDANQVSDVVIADRDTGELALVSVRPRQHAGRRSEQLSVHQCGWTLRRLRERGP